MSGQEVDSIVLFNLKSIGCDLSEAHSIGDFDSNIFFRACSSCVKAILQSQQGDDVPLDLPKMTAKRWKACTTLSDALKEAGYPQEIAYNQFMYPNADEMKRVLLWLVNALPQKEEAEDSTAAAVGLTPYQRIMASFSDLHKLTVQKKTRRLRRITRDEAAGYVPSAVGSLQTSNWSQPFCYSSNEAEQTYFAEKIAYYPQQMHTPEALSPSLLEYNSSRIAREKIEEGSWTTKGIYSGVSQKEWKSQQAGTYADRVAELLAKASVKYNNVQIDLSAIPDEPSSPLTHKVKSRFAKDVEFQKTERAEADTEEEKDDKIDESLTSAEAKRKAQQAEEEQLKDTVEKLHRKIEKMDAQLNKMEQDVISAKKLTTAESDKMEGLEGDGEELETQFQTQKKTMEFADDIEGSKKHLKEERDAVQAEIDGILEQFNTKESKYRSEYETLTAAQEGAKRELQNLLDDVKDMKAKVKNLGQEIKDKDDKKAALEAEYSKLPKNIDRELFVSRIMDIIKNIKKQQNEITKINIDNRELQKEINNTNDAVSRSFVATEEKIYKDATKDDVAKKVYKQLIALREAFDQLISKVETTGSIKQQEHDLEEKKSKMMARDDDLNMEHLQQDLANIKSENATLAAELKQLRGK